MARRRASRQTGKARLAGLAVGRVLAAARAVLRDLHAVRIVPLVLLGMVRPLSTVRAGQCDQRPICFLCHDFLPRVNASSVRAGSSGPNTPKSRYSVIDVTTPAPTVRPPSRIAKRSPS